MATSGEHGGEPPKRRGSRLRWAVAGLVALVAALAVFAWQTGGDGDGDGPLNAIAAAAERTQREPGGRATMRTVVSSPAQSEPLTITGRSVYTDERTRGVMTFRDPESGERMKMLVVSDGASMYMRSDLFGSLPDGREWMGFDLSVLPGMETPTPAEMDAKSELAMLEEATGGVRKLGEEEVRGVPTTRYSGEIDNVERAEELREEGAGKIASQLEHGSPIAVEAWIDREGLIRRMRILQTQMGEGGEQSIDIRMDLFDFGIEPQIEAPAAGEVFDITDIAEREIRG